MKKTILTLIVVLLTCLSASAQIEWVGDDVIKPFIMNRQSGTGVYAYYDEVPGYRSTNCQRQRRKGLSQGCIEVLLFSGEQFPEAGTTDHKTLLAVAEKNGYTMEFSKSRKRALLLYDVLKAETTVWLKDTLQKILNSDLIEHYYEPDSIYSGIWRIERSTDENAGYLDRLVTTAKGLQPSVIMTYSPTKLGSTLSVHLYQTDTSNYRSAQSQYFSLVMTQGKVEIRGTGWSQTIYIEGGSAIFVTPPAVKRNLWGIYQHQAEALPSFIQGFFIDGKINKELSLIASKANWQL